MNQKKYISIATALLIFLTLTSKAQENYQHWKIQLVQLQTRWAKEVDPSNALPEYPRPQMVRPNWTNLNGLWDYVITTKDVPLPQSYGGKILVPYPLESALSGVKKQLQPSQNLWYHRTFTLSKGEGRTLLHFGAVDWQVTVFVNGKKAGPKDTYRASHTGGYTEFTLDITPYLKRGKNDLVVKVFDPTDEGIGPHGKQMLKPESIFYTSTSGIWQTVWLEEVPKSYIDHLTITPNIDSGYVSVTVQSATAESVKLKADGHEISGLTNTLIHFPIANEHLWSPNDPYLYDLDVKTNTDEVKSYFGMRKISIGKDEKGIDRIFLNNKYTYNLGVLDQGFWPDGIYTAPTDEALAFDIKHIKVEPARWYYWADKLGMMVWQDMVNPDFDLKPGAKEAFEQQCKEELAQLHNYPCITTWVLFNEKWGQYDQKRLTDWIKQTDPSRIVNGHTGEYLYVNGELRSPSPDAYVDADLTDVHSYPSPMMPIKQAGKAQVVGEFGGIGVHIPGHDWEKGWGYVQVTPAQLEGKYHIMVNDLKLLEQQGLSGSIYTQPYDVEGEENGLMTYDREIVKVPIAEMQKINSLLIPTAPNIPNVSFQPANTRDSAEVYAEAMQSYIQNPDGADHEELTNLLLLAGQQNDRLGVAGIAPAYFEQLSKQTSFSKEDLELCNEYSKNINDYGFAILARDADQFADPKNRPELYNKLTGMLYTSIIAPKINGNSTNWNAIATVLQAYGSTGKQALLKAKVNDDLLNQDWKAYGTDAKQYLANYSNRIPDSEKEMLQSELKEQAK
jgi:hypothetical protein